MWMMKSFQLGFIGGLMSNFNDTKRCGYDLDILHISNN